MNLDSASAPWGKWVQRKIEELSRDASRGQLNDLNANKQAGSSVGLLSGQVQEMSGVLSDLAGLRSYSASTPGGTTTTPTDINGIRLEEGPRIDLTLTRSANVLLSVGSEFDGASLVMGSSRTVLGAGLYVQNASEYVLQAFIQRADNAEIHSTGWVRREFNVPMFASRILTLQAGKHTFLASNSALVLIGDEGHATLKEITLSATVLNYTDPNSKPV